MSNYTKINFQQIDNSSKTDGNEARFARSHIGSTELGVSLFKYGPNFKADSGHSHKTQEEVYVVIRGGGLMLLDNEAIDLKLDDVVRVAPEVIRAFAAGPEGLDILAIGGQKPAEGDGVKGDANWPPSDQPDKLPSL